MFALVNANNPVLDDLLAQGVTPATLTKIFISGQITSWGDVIENPSIPDEIHVYTRSDICGAAATWGTFLGGTQADLLGSRKLGDPGMVQSVQKDALGIGYNNLIYAYGLGDVAPEGTVILPLDLDGNGLADQDEILDTREKAARAITTERYPTPPSRVLYLVTNGQPEGITQAFLIWILTHGQAYVEPTGYIRLPGEQLEVALQKIQ